MLALRKGTFQQTALLPRRACLGLQAVRQRSPALPLHKPQATLAAASNILYSSTEHESASNGSSNTNGKQQPLQQDEEVTQPTDAGSTTPFPAPDSLQQPTPSSTSDSKAQPSAKSSSSSSSGGVPEPAELGGGPPNNLPPQLQRLLLLLTEFGGIYGTAAVAIAWFTHIDPFGNLHWSSADVMLGLATFAPLLALDAILMLPDYAIGPEDSQEVAGMFFGDPEALRSMTAGNIGVAAGATANTELSTDNNSSSSADSTATPASSSSSSSSPNPLLRVRVALELLQQVYTRANPGIGLSPAAELAVVVVAVLADEMLYRAVGLTLLGLWLRDRLYEAGFDETVSLAWLGRSMELPTPDFARYAAVALVACLGIAGFAAGALREREALKRLQVLDKDGTPSEKADALKAQLVASIGSQNIVMYGVEGVREVTAAIMAGFAFVATGNLAAPLAGSMAAQSLFSVYQRYSLARAKKKRKELLGKMKQRSEKLQAAMKAALTAKKAAGDTTAEPAAAASADTVVGFADGGEAEGDDAVGSAGEVDAADSSSSGKQEDVDFLTLVLQAAEQQQQQEKEQQRQQQQRQRQAEQAAAVAEVKQHLAAEEPAASVADWAAATVADSSSSSSSSEAAPSSSSNGDGSAAAAEAAKQQLGVLLEDMLRSPEGFKVVQRWLQAQPNSSSSSSSVESNGSSSSGFSSSTDPRQAVEQLLADPEVKARLLAELQEQLCAISEAQMRRQKQQDTWRQ